MAQVPLNRPLWLEHASPAFPALESDVECDVAVVGGGITGLTAAYALKQEGRRVVLLEASRVGFGASGYTTAKLTVGHNLIYRSLVDSFGVEAAAAYARSNQEAVEWVSETVGRHGIECDFEHTSNYVYVESPDAAASVESEVEAARAAGVEAELTSETDLPYPVAASIRVEGQAQFHPWKYLAALARLVDGEGSRVFEEARATGVRSGDPCIVTTERGRAVARHVIIATQMPFFDRGLLFALAHPTKSYAVAAAVSEDGAPRGMYISADQPTRSVRSTPGPNGRRILIVGGEGHKPGNEQDTGERYARLERFLQERFRVEAAEYHWSTHDYTPVDGLPYIGRLRLGDDRILGATGFAKWGMTKGTLAGLLLTDLIVGRTNEYAALYDPRRIDARRSVARFAKENGAVAGFFVRDRFRPRPGRGVVESLAPGEGTIVRVGTAQRAVCRDGAGTLHVLSARCTHLGCIVGWNPADRAWECPCHGSRFAADGTLVQGPATADLPRRGL